MSVWLETTVLFGVIAGTLIWLFVDPLFYYPNFLCVFVQVLWKSHRSLWEVTRRVARAGGLNRRLRLLGLLAMAGVVLAIIILMGIELMLVPDDRVVRGLGIIVAILIVGSLLWFQEELRWRALVRRLRTRSSELAQLAMEVRDKWPSRIVFHGDVLELKPYNDHPNVVMYSSERHRRHDLQIGLIRRLGPNATRVAVDVTIQGFTVELCDNNQTPESFVDDLGNITLTHELISYWKLDTNLFIASYSIPELMC